MSDRVKVTPFTATGGFQFRDKTRESLENIDAALDVAEAAVEAIEGAGVLGFVPAVVTQTETLRGDFKVDIEDSKGNPADGLARVWFSTTEGGAPSATNNTVAFGTGTTIQIVLADAHYLVLADDGEIVGSVTINTDGDRFVNVEVGGKVKTIKLAIATIE
jgi:hypothetical protein